MNKLLAALAMAGILLSGLQAHAQQPVKPTIVLVHGAFADTSSWNGVIKRYLRKTAIRQRQPLIPCAVSLAMRSTSATSCPV